jgi:copper(I)-binding protein
MKKLIAIAASLLLLSGCATQPEISVKDYWVKSSEMSVQGGMTAIFGTITNNTDKDVTLVGGATEVANVVEIHEMAMIDGEMKMQKIDGGLVIPAGQSVVLEPGGNHVMLMDLTQAIEAGAEISVTLDLEGANDITLEGVIAKPSEGGDEEYHNEDMGH